MPVNIPALITTAQTGHLSLFNNKYPFMHILWNLCPQFKTTDPVIPFLHSTQFFSEVLTELLKVKYPDMIDKTSRINTTEKIVLKNRPIIEILSTWLNNIFMNKQALTIKTTYNIVNKVDMV